MITISTESTFASEGGGSAFVWLGGADIAGDGNWAWSDSSNFGGYTHWGNAEPGSQSAQQRLALSLEPWQVQFQDGETGEWKSVGGDRVLYSVLEWDEVLDINTVPEGDIFVYGEAVSGSLLVAETGAINDADGIGNFSYQWFRDDQAIAGAISSKYLLGGDDVGSLVTVSLSYTDGSGYLEVVDSEARLPSVPTSSSYVDLIGMYVVILGRAPDQSGLDFWSDKINGGRTFEDVANAMWNSPGAQAAYEDAESAAEQVAAVYTNVLSREPDDEGLEFWLARWEENGPVDTMLRMINSLAANNSDDPQAIADKVLFSAKVDVGGYLATYLGSDDIGLAADAFAYLEAGHSTGEVVDYIGQSNTGASDLLLV